jgi:hypothetical protein
MNIEQMFANAVAEGSLKAGNEIHAFMQPSKGIIEIPSPMTMANIIIRCINESLPKE